MLILVPIGLLITVLWYIRHLFSVSSKSRENMPDSGLEENNSHEQLNKNTESPNTEQKEELQNNISMVEPPTARTSLRQKLSRLFGKQPPPTATLDTESRNIVVEPSFSPTKCLGYTRYTDTSTPICPIDWSEAHKEQEPVEEQLTVDFDTNYIHDPALPPYAPLECPTLPALYVPGTARRPLGAVPGLIVLVVILACSLMWKFNERYLCASQSSTEHTRVPPAHFEDSATASQQRQGHTRRSLDIAQVERVLDEHLVFQPNAWPVFRPVSTPAPTHTPVTRHALAPYPAAAPRRTLVTHPVERIVHAPDNVVSRLTEFNVVPVHALLAAAPPSMAPASTLPKPSVHDSFSVSLPIRKGSIVSHESKTPQRMQQSFQLPTSVTCPHSHALSPTPTAVIVPTPTQAALLAQLAGWLPELAARHPSTISPSQALGEYVLELTLSNDGTGPRGLAASVPAEHWMACLCAAAISLASQDADHVPNIIGRVEFIHALCEKKNVPFLKTLTALVLATCGPLPVFAAPVPAPALAPAVATVFGLTVGNDAAAAVTAATAPRHERLLEEFAAGQVAIMTSCKKLRMVKDQLFVNRLFSGLVALLTAPIDPRLKHERAVNDTLVDIVRVLRQLRATKPSLVQAVVSSEYAALLCTLERNDPARDVFGQLVRDFSESDSPAEHSVVARLLKDDDVDLPMVYELRGEDGTPPENGMGYSA